MTEPKRAPMPQWVKLAGVAVVIGLGGLAGFELQPYLRGIDGGPWRGLVLGVLGLWVLCLPVGLALALVGSLRARRYRRIAEVLDRALGTSRTARE